MDREAKLHALRQIAILMNEGALLPLLSFFAGRLDKVRFVKDLTDAGVGVHLSTNMRLWPRIPFRAEIDGRQVNNPIAFIEQMALRDDDLFVRVEVGTDEAPSWLEPVLEEYAQGRRDALETSIDQIRDKIDLALDAYRTASDALDEADSEHRKYLKFVLEKAKEDMRTLNARLDELERMVGKVE